ncbi:hypothetical protein [Streptomyces sp. NPDC088258]|uniref:hypothetical protein n=1 Tax=Streptomyces sp. NPDC088258 TaxID=3365849 RepID=UPI0037FE9D94
MTTATAPSVDWVRLTVDGSDITLTPSPDIDLRLVVGRVEHDGPLDPITTGPLPGFSLSVDLVPLHPLDRDAVFRCEMQAREVAVLLGTSSPTRGGFTVEAALGGEGWPHERLEVPRLYLTPTEPPDFDAAQPLPVVRVFTAKMVATEGVAYTLRRVD